MPLKLRRIQPGFYLTEVDGVEYRIANVDGQWIVTTGRVGDPAVYRAETKKKVVTYLEGIVRSGRTTTKSLKIPRRTRIVPGTEITLLSKSVHGVIGRVTFMNYTQTSDGKEWIEVKDRNGRSRLIDPAKIKQIHRKPKAAR